MKPLLSLLTLALLAAGAAAQPTLDIPAEVRPAGEYVVLTPKTDAVSVVYIGLSRIDPVPSAVLKDPRTFLLNTRGIPEGRYLFAAVGADKAGAQVRVDFAVVIGTPPPGPTPPGPTPPTPPGPTPAPIPEAGLHVLVIEETADRGKLTPGQKEVILSKTIRDYLDAKCAKDGDAGAYRIWDKDQAGTENDSPKWASAFKRARAASGFATPWLILSNSKVGGYEGPLPKTAAEFMELAKKFE